MKIAGCSALAIVNKRNSNSDFYSMPLIDPASTQRGAIRFMLLLVTGTIEQDVIIAMEISWSRDGENASLISNEDIKTKTEVFEQIENYNIYMSSGNRTIEHWSSIFCNKSHQHDELKEDSDHSQDLTVQFCRKFQNTCLKAGNLLGAGYWIINVTK